MPVNARYFATVFNEQDLYTGSEAPKYAADGSHDRHESIVVGKVLVMHAPAENCDLIKERGADDVKRKSHQRQSPTEFRGPAQSGGQLGIESGPESGWGGNMLNAVFGNPGIMIRAVILFHEWKSSAGFWSKRRWSALEPVALA